MIFAEIKLSSQPGASALRLDGLDSTQPPSSRLLSLAREEATGTVLVLVGRLHYRDDLKRRLGPRADPTPQTHADWALAAYCAGPPPALAALEVDFSLLLSDPRTRLRHLHHSVIGDVPPYWWQAGGTTLAGTSLHSLAAQAGRWDVNQDHLADFLLDPHTSAGLGA